MFQNEKLNKIALEKTHDVVGRYDPEYEGHLEFEICMEAESIEELVEMFKEIHGRSRDIDSRDFAILCKNLITKGIYLGSGAAQEGIRKAKEERMKYENSHRI